MRGMAKVVAVVGAGFGGLHAVRGLAKEEDIQIVVVSRTNHTLFQPLLYQVATGALDEDEIATPVRRVLRKQKNVRFVMAEVDKVDVVNKRVHVRSHVAEADFAYDTLIVAAGVEYNYFGKDEWKGLAPSLKTIADAEEIRRRVLLAFEEAENTTDPARRAALLNYVLIGGGPTGVELAGAIAELLKESLSRELTLVKPEEVSILIVEAGPRILGPFPEDLAAASAKRLESLGVEIHPHTKVTVIDADGIEMQAKNDDGTLGPKVRVPTETAIWTAGVKGVPMLASLGVPLDKSGRVPVGPDLRPEGLPDVYVIGDAAEIKGEDGKPLPGVAQVAMQSGSYVARHILGRESKPFAYFDKGNMAVVGKGFAIADLHKLHLKGLVAWFAWLFIHILYLSTFRSKFFVLQRWLSAYLFTNRSAVVFDAPSPLAPVDTMVPAQNPPDAPAQPQIPVEVPVGDRPNPAAPHPTPAAP